MTPVPACTDAPQGPGSFNIPTAVGRCCAPAQATGASTQSSATSARPSGCLTALGRHRSTRRHHGPSVEPIQGGMVRWPSRRGSRCWRRGCRRCAGARVPSPRVVTPAPPPPGSRPAVLGRGVSAAVARVSLPTRTAAGGSNARPSSRAPEAGGETRWPFPPRLTPARTPSAGVPSCARAPTGCARRGDATALPRCARSCIPANARALPRIRPCRRRLRRSALDSSWVE
jgi:hypothetical protein